MSFKAKIAAAAATFALAGGGLDTAGALSASAATPSCGDHCGDVYTQKLAPASSWTRFRGRAAAGQEVILFQVSNGDPAVDFVVKDLGPVSGLYTTGKHSLITPQFDRAYGSNEAYQVQYAPLGVPKPPLRRHLAGCDRPALLQGPAGDVRPLREVDLGRGRNPAGAPLHGDS